MRMRSTTIGVLLILLLTGCTPQAESPARKLPTNGPTPTISNPAPNRIASIVIGAQLLTVTEPSGLTHTYSYDRWLDDLVPLVTSLLHSAPRVANHEGDSDTPPTTSYLWPELFITHSDWASDGPGVQRLIVHAQGQQVGSVDIATAKGVRVGDTAASVADYPIFCNANKECFENQKTTSGASTTLRILDSSDAGPKAVLVLGYVDAASGVTDIVTANTSWGTTRGIDVRD